MIGLPLTIAVLLLAHQAGAELSGAAPTMAACAAILLFGLPHGALDLEIIRQDYDSGRAGKLATLVLYLGLAFAMWGVWYTNPVAALALFLCVATAHFAEDMLELRSAFLAQGTAIALLTGPVWLHSAELKEIFTSLTGAGEAVLLADVMLLLAPTSMAVAAVGMWTLVQAGHYDRFIKTALVLTGMTVLPPIVGFACFFCLYHSPAHFGAALRRVSASPRIWFIVVTITGAALGLASILFWAEARPAVSARFIAATFMTLSVLTVPHMLVPMLLKAARARSLRIYSIRSEKPTVQV